MLETTLLNMRKNTYKLTSVIVFIITNCFFNTAFAQQAEESLEIDIVHTSIEELLTRKVTSVTKTDEPLWGSAAAIYVLTGEQIHRSGATSIPEALRLVPGVQVARIDANKWAVSARGFNSRTANKLLVLIDGRSVYDPLFSGVLWESKDVMLEDVDRIEVVRGPGGTLWGANAVNGVINIITKHSKDTQGGLYTAGGGTEERAFGGARYGVKTGSDSYLRVYGKGQKRDDGFIKNEDTDDSSQFAQGGFRFDSELEDRSSLTFQGDAYEGEQGFKDADTQPDQETTGGNLLVNWSKALADNSRLQMLMYWDHTELDFSFLGERRDSIGSNVEYLFYLTPAQKVVTGMLYRYTSDDIRNSEMLALEPDSRSDHLVSGFVEDTVEVIKEKLFVTLGTKLSYNDYTGFEIYPTARFSSLLNESNSFWGAISRSARVPSRLEDDFRIVASPDLVFTGNSDLDAETLIAYELGYRSKLSEKLYLDFATFYNVYDELVSVEGFTLGNKSDGDTYGAEFSVSWQALPLWRLEAAYTYLQMQLSLDESSLDNPTSIDRVEGNNPQNQFSVQSLLDLGSSWECDFAVRYVDSLPAFNVDSYIVADLRVGYKITDEVEISVIGQNLFDKHHFEQGDSLATEVEQGAYAKLQGRF